MQEPLCKKCGKPIAGEEAEYCADCGKREHAYLRGRAVFEYNRLMKASIARFKYHNRLEYADFYAEEMLKNLGRELRSWQPDALIPIPLHKSRMRKRGFNQAALVARILGRRLGIPVEEKALIRQKKTSPQKELSDRERRANLKQAFQPGEIRPEWRTVVLVDDIYTTGSTMDAAARILRSAGVEKVYFLSICIGRGF